MFYGQLYTQCSNTTNSDAEIPVSLSSILQSFCMHVLRTQGNHHCDKKETEAALLSKDRGVCLGQIHSMEEPEIKMPLWEVPSCLKKQRLNSSSTRDLALLHRAVDLSKIMSLLGESLLVTINTDH